jgi:sugar diacid utilization regulator
MNDETHTRATEQRRTETVLKLLSGETVDPADLAELDYEVHASWHLGVIAIGVGAEEFLGRLKAHFGRKLLVVSLDGRVCAWLGGQERLAAADIERLSINSHKPLLAIGEPGRGIDGLRLTHDQAQEALGVALRKPERFARYADGRVLAATVQNDTLARSLRQKYIIPLRSQRDGGATLRRTLRAYIGLECNATSATEVLKVGRRAVKSRVHTVETLIGCALGECLGELDAALQLEELDRAAAAGDAPTTQ